VLWSIYNTFNKEEGERNEQDTTGKELVDRKVFRTLGNFLTILRALNNKQLSWVMKYQDKHFAKTFLDNLNNNDFVSVIKSILNFNDLHEVEFFSYYPFKSRISTYKEEFLLKKVEFLLLK
jgi:hypothetical protein